MAVRDYIAKYQADLSAYELDAAIRETQQLEQAQDELARASDTMADRVAADWRDMARDIDTAADRIERTTDQVDRDTRESFKETGREAGSEFVQNLGESISSGDLSSIAGDTAGGLASTFGMAGPIGLAFAGLATGASLVFAGIQQRAQRVSDATKSAFEDLIAAADRESRFRNQVSTLFGDMQTGIDTLSNLAEKTGVPMRDIADALTGGARSAQRLGEEIRSQIPFTDKQLQNARGVPKAQLDQIQKARELLKILEDSEQVQRDAAKSASAYKGFIDDATRSWAAFGDARAKALGARSPRANLADFDPYTTKRRRG